MRIFLCYSSKNIAQAEAIKLRLVSDGQWVFFDRSSLAPGEEFDARIRETISQSHLFIFLITPESVAEGSYCRTELKFARERWNHPKGHVLPVMLTKIPWELVPEYLKAVTILEPEGNAPAEIAQAVDRVARASCGRILRRFGWAALIIGVVIAVCTISAHHKTDSITEEGHDSLAPTNAQPLTTNLFSRARTVVPCPKGFFIGLADPGEVALLSPNGRILPPTVRVPGEPVGMAIDGDSLFVATARSNAVVRLTGISLGVAEVISVPELTVSDGSNETHFSSVPTSLAVITNEVWLLTSREGAQAGLLRRSKGIWAAPAYLTNDDLAFDLDSSQLYQMRGKILVLTSSSPHYIYELTADNFIRYSGHDYTDSIGSFDAIGLASSGNIMGLGSDFEYMEVELNEGRVRILKKGPGLPASFPASSWDCETLVDHDGALLIGVTQIERGTDNRTLQGCVVKLSAAGDITELLQQPDATVVALSANEDSAVAILRGSIHAYRSYLVHLK
jgi:uncharacterized protein YjeT (DUF2065 family)